MNVEIIKKIKSEKNTTVPSLRNQDWKTVKAETEKKKNKRIIDTYLNERHQGIKRNNLYGREISLC